MAVLKTIDENQGSDSILNPKDVLVLDYMRAYFDFYSAEQQDFDNDVNMDIGGKFRVAREVLAKYGDSC